MNNWDTHLEPGIDYAISPIGMLVHNRKDWPCAVCRPLNRTETPGAFLCIDCAHDLVASMIHAADVLDSKGAVDTISDLADALAQLDDPVFNFPALINN